MVFGFESFRAHCTQTLGQALCVPCSVLNYRSPVPLSEFQMAPILSFLISSGSKKKEPRYVCLSEAKASHSHKIWTEISSSVPHFLQVGLLLSPIVYRCLHNVLCPVSRPITTMDCVPLKDNNRDLVARSTASVVQWSEFLATDTEFSGSIPGATRFSEQQWVWNGVHSAS